MQNYIKWNWSRLGITLLEDHDHITIYIYPVSFTDHNTSLLNIINNKLTRFLWGDGQVQISVDQISLDIKMED